MKDYVEEYVELASIGEISLEEIQFQDVVKELYATGFKYRNAGTLEIECLSYYLTEELKKYKELNLMVSRKETGDIIVNFPSGLQQATIYIEKIANDSTGRYAAICFELDGTIHLSQSVEFEMKPIIIAAFIQWVDWLSRLYKNKIS